MGHIFICFVDVLEVEQLLSQTILEIPKRHCLISCIFVPFIFYNGFPTPNSPWDCLECAAFTSTVQLQAVISLVKHTIIQYQCLYVQVLIKIQFGFY